MFTDRRWLYAFLAFAACALCVAAPRDAFAQYADCATINGSLCPDKATATSTVMNWAQQASASYGPDGGPPRGPLYNEPYRTNPTLGVQTGAVTAYSTYLGNDVASNWREYPLGPTSDQCDARNNDPEQAPGPGLYLDSAVADKCVGGCTLTVVGNPIEVVQGRVQGQPANFYRFNRQYAGACSDPETSDGNEFQPTPDDPSKKCNPSAGVCVQSNGDTEYCTFDQQGNPLTCVPAVDYDNDGVSDEDDEEPGTPTNEGDDGRGDESDNSASGGASCSGPAPSCSGDQIACYTLYQQWKTRCAVEGLSLKFSGGGIPGEDPDDQFDASAERSALDALYPDGDGLDGVSPSDAWATGEGGTFDSSRFGTGGGCPAFPNFQILGQTFQRPAVFCDIVAVIRLLVLASGFLYCASIVLRAD